MIEPMLTAKENYVRQGALLASAFILIQHTEATCSKVLVVFLSFEKNHF